MQMCAGVPGPQGASEGTSGLDTQRSCRRLVPAESRGAFSVTGQAASVCSPSDQYHCKRVLGPGSEMPPRARPSRAALASSPACPYLHARPQPIRIPPRRSSRGLPASAAATSRCQGALGPPGCPSCPALSPALVPLLPPGTSWTEGQSPGEGGRVLSAPRCATEAA